MKMYGDGLSLTIPDVDRTRYLLILGANPAASNGSMLTMGDARARLRGIRERGGRIVLVDPRRTESADWSDEHHWIRPGGDAAFVLAILHVIFAEDLADVASLAKSTRGLAALRGCAQRFPPHRVAEAVGIAPATITRIARELARAEAAVAYCRVGVCQSELGLVASWLVEALNVVTGNFDRPGGMMFTKPAADIGPLARAAVGNHHGRWRSRVRGLPEFLGSFPSGALLEEMTTPGPGQIRALVTLAGNPVLSIPGGARLADALARLDAVVSINPYVNETTRHAHVILPPASPLETSHFDLLFNAVSVRNTVSYSEPVLPRSDDALDDYEILTGLAKRLAGRRAGDGATGRTIERALEKLLPSTDDALALLFRLGPYGDHFVPGRQGLTLAKVREAPHGIDLGPLVPMGRERVRTPDGRVDLAPEVLLADVSRVETWLAERRNGGLLLIGRRHLRSNNSWMHNLRSLVKGPDRSALLVHPDDAARHGLVEGATCRVKSRAGEVRARVAITRDIMPGVVSLPHGYGHAAAADTLHVAGPLPGANINVLTDNVGRADPRQLDPYGHPRERRARAMTLSRLPLCGAFAVMIAVASAPGCTSKTNASPPAVNAGPVVTFEESSNDRVADPAERLLRRRQLEPLRADVVQLAHRRRFRLGGGLDDRGALPALEHRERRGHRPDDGAPRRERPQLRHVHGRELQQLERRSTVGLHRGHAREPGHGSGRRAHPRRRGVQLRQHRDAVRARRVPRDQTTKCPPAARPT